MNCSEPRPGWPEARYTIRNRIDAVVRRAATPRGILSDRAHYGYDDQHHRCGTDSAYGVMVTFNAVPDRSI